MTRVQMTKEQFSAMSKRVGWMIPNEKPSKYRAIKTTVDGITFDSKAEARRYSELKQLQQAGEISGFGIQPSFLVSREVRYRPDFIVCGKDGLNIWVEDVKGHVTKEFTIKAKLFHEKYPWLDLKIIK